MTRGISFLFIQSPPTSSIKSEDSAMRLFFLSFFLSSSTLFNTDRLSFDQVERGRGEVFFGGRVYIFHHHCASRERRESRVECRQT
jgi:hypothetical protein